MEIGIILWYYLKYTWN